MSRNSLNNIVKHSAATQAEIQLCLTELPWIEITDNGRGFELEKLGHGKGLGLSGIRERAAEIGWSLEIQTAPGAGTRIRLEKIIPAKENDDVS